MSAILDTLAASRKLEESGMPEPQADAVVEVVKDAMNDLVTKEHLTAVKVAIANSKPGAWMKCRLHRISERSNSFPPEIPKA